MDDPLLKRVLSEWIRDRKKERAEAETKSLKKITDRTENLLIFQRLFPVLSLRALDYEFTRFKKDHP